MIPVLINNPLFRGITPEKLSANLEEISFHTRSYCRPQSDCPAFSVWRRKSLSGGGDSQRTDRGYRNS